MTVRDLSMNESTVEVAGVTENYLGDIVYVSQTYYEAHLVQWNLMQSGKVYGSV